MPALAEPACTWWAFVCCVKSTLTQLAMRLLQRRHSSESLPGWSTLVMMSRSKSWRWTCSSTSCATEASVQQPGVRVRAMSQSTCRSRCVLSTSPMYESIDTTTNSRHLGALACWRSCNYECGVEDPFLSPHNAPCRAYSTLHHNH